jgi:hypothetical protein
MRLEDGLLGEEVGECVRGGGSECEGEVGDVEGEDIRPHGDEVEFVERVHRWRVRGLRMRSGLGRRERRRWVRGLHRCIAF